MNLPNNAPLEEIYLQNDLKSGVRLFLKREDKIHPIISGNKWRKLYYNIKFAKKNKINSIVTMGGAFSNHIAATAHAGKIFGFNTIGYIRGDELKKLNSTLSFAKLNGMKFKFVSRSLYKTGFFLEKYKNQKKYKDYMIIPEGGSNQMGIDGCKEIYNDIKIDFDYICCSVGTGGTLSGIASNLKKNQYAFGFSSLKGANYLNDVVRGYTKSNNWKLIMNYHFGGYAKINDELIDFINFFKEKYNIQLDPIYTGKLIFGIFDLIKKNFFKKKSTIIAVHSGGIQGIKGINDKLNNNKIII